MQELIKIEKVEGKETVNARDLWEFLESKQEFATWIKTRIVNYEFEKGNDYIVIDKLIKNSNGGRPSIEYHLSLDMGKELSMLERNEKGKQARKYFIECEKQLKELKPQLPGNYKDALIALVSEIEEKEKLEIVIKEQKPKIEFHDELVESDGLYSMGEAAKILGTGRTRFFIKLREMKVFFNTEPYQAFKERGYFEVKTTTKNSHVQTQAFVTPKGLEWLNKKLKENGDFQTSF